MMTSSNGNISALLALCERNPPVTSGFPSQCQWRRALIFSLICTLNQRLRKQSWGWWFETLLRSLWRHCYDRPNNVDSIYMSLRPHICVGCCCFLGWNFPYPLFALGVVKILKISMFLTFKTAKVDWMDLHQFFTTQRQWILTNSGIRHWQRQWLFVVPHSYPTQRLVTF